MSEQLEELRISAKSAVEAMLRGRGHPDEVRDRVDTLQGAIDPLSLPSPSSLSSLPPANLLPIAQALRDWVQQSPPCGATKQYERNLQFAQYCASSAVVDERVLELQLTHCDNVGVGAKIRAIFSRKQEVIAFLLKRPAASAVSKALQPHAATSPDVVALCDVVRKLESLAGVDEATFAMTICFLCRLVLVRKKEHNAFGCIVEQLLSSNNDNNNNSFVNRPTFTALEKRLLAQYYESDAGNLDEVGVSEETDDDDDCRRGDAKEQAPFVTVRRPCAADPRGDRIALIGEIEPRGAGAALSAHSMRRLVFVARTCADMRAAHATKKATHCHIGSFGLQIAGNIVQVTLLVQVHQSLYVNLLLCKATLDECTAVEAIQLLALMISIGSTDDQLDDEIVRTLFPNNDDWAQLDATIVSSAPEPAPSPSDPPTALYALSKCRQYSAQEVPLGTIVVDHDDRAVVRSADGDVTFKVLLTETGAARARSEAAHELRVHKLLSRRAAAHVVPLLVHIEALVALPGQEWWQSRGSIVLVMPWCEQVNASELHDVSEVARCVEALLGALRALHRLGVLHGDVKWSNTLWLCEQKGELRRLVLSDFGLAQQLDVDGRATLQRGVGTEDYMAPEVRRGSGLFVSAAADVYSAGVALRKLPAHAVCEPLQALVSLMCAKRAYERPSAEEARDLWVRTVVPALSLLVAIDSCSDAAAQSAPSADQGQGDR
jgi:hypothetical protein